MVYVFRKSLGLMEPIYANIMGKETCVNARDVVKSILKNYPQETIYSVANRAGVIQVQTIKQWMLRNTAMGWAMKKAYDSIISDYT